MLAFAQNSSRQKELQTVLIAANLALHSVSYWLSSEQSQHFPLQKRNPTAKKNPNAGTVRHFFTNTHLVCHSKVCVCFLGQNYLWTVFDYWYWSSFHLVYSLFEPIYIFNCTNFTGKEFLNSPHRKNSRWLAFLLSGRRGTLWKHNKQVIFNYFPCVCHSTYTANLYSVPSLRGE